jgi:hypothetical protein
MQGDLAANLLPEQTQSPLRPSEMFPLRCRLELDTAVTIECLQPRVAAPHRLAWLLTSQ